MPLNKVLLMNDANYPVWLVLVPRLDGLREVLDLSPVLREQLWEEVDVCCKVVQVRMARPGVRIGRRGPGGAPGAARSARRRGLPREASSGSRPGGAPRGDLSPNTFPLPFDNPSPPPPDLPPRPPSPLPPSVFLQEVFAPYKLNIATIGNVVRA